MHIIFIVGFIISALVLFQLGRSIWERSRDTFFEALPLIILLLFVCFAPPSLVVVALFINWVAHSVSFTPPEVLAAPTKMITVPTQEKETPKKKDIDEVKTAVRKTMKEELKKQRRKEQA